MQLNKFVSPELLLPIPDNVGRVDGWRDTGSPVFSHVEESGESLVNIAEYGIVGQSAYHDGPQYVRRTVADMLAKAQKLLPSDFKLVLFDGWRSLETQRALYQKEYARQMDHSETQKYVSLPSDDPAIPSPHNTGGAVDVAIFYKGKMLDFGTGFDHMAPASHLSYYETKDAYDEEAPDSRRVLYAIMTRVGFEPYEEEWWHFNYGNQMASAAYHHRTGESQKVQYGACDPGGRTS